MIWRLGLTAVLLFLLAFWLAVVWGVRALVADDVDWAAVVMGEKA